MVTPEEVLAKITALKDAATEKDAAETKATEADTAKTDAEAKATVATLQGQLAIAANEAVSRAVEAGRITPADAEAKVAEILAANDESAAARIERAVLVANEYANTNPALSEGERKCIAWQRAQKKASRTFREERLFRNGRVTAR